MKEIREFVDVKGGNTCGDWFDGLNAQAAAKVAITLIRMEQENLLNVKSVGTGVFEYRLNFDPGYRIYFGTDGDKLIILLGGGTKKRQQNDIESATKLWREYKKRKRET